MEPKLCEAMGIVNQRFACQKGATVSEHDLTALMGRITLNKLL
jgi:hypothetical protein